MSNHEIIVYSIPEVAEIMKMNPRTIYNYVVKGKLKASKFGHNWRIRKEDLEEFIKRGA